MKKEKIDIGGISETNNGQNIAIEYLGPVT